MTKMLHAWYMECVGYFEDCFGRHPGPGARREIYQAIMAGMTHETLMAIMDEAECAPRPSWAYSLAILHRCLESGIMTIDAWQRDKQARRRQSKPDMQYIQREYTEEDFGPDFYFDYDRDYMGGKRDE